MNKRRLFFISIAVIAAVLTVVVAGGRKGKDALQNEDKVIFRLNDTLTNEMSDIPELHGLDRKMRTYLRKWHM